MVKINLRYCYTCIKFLGEKALLKSLSVSVSYIEFSFVFFSLYVDALILCPVGWPAFWRVPMAPSKSVFLCACPSF